MSNVETPDIVVIGGGIAGGGFATVMARAGHSVLMLEITEQHRDVVRGEWLAPWGVMEAKRLGLYDLYRSHGAHHVKRHIGYDDDVPREEAEARSLALDALMPGSDGPMTLGHPRACGILDDAAVAAGARFLRGVRKTRVTPGARPTVTFEHGGVAHEIKPRLVVAADGRHCKTAQQVGLKIEGDPARRGTRTARGAARQGHDGSVDRGPPLRPARRARERAGRSVHGRGAERGVGGGVAARG